MQVIDGVESGLHTRWNRRLIGLVTVLVLVNFMVDTAITAPLIVLPQMLEHFGTDQAAWLNASAMLAGAMWAPLLGKSADVHGKRKILVLTLLISCAGALVCAVAPTTWAFVAGRLLQGSAVAALFLTVAIVRDVCAPRLAMVVVGIVTSGSAVLNIVSRFATENLAAENGFQVLFVLSAAVAAAMALAVRAVVAESPITTPGRIDFGGAALLGTGLIGVLSYISLGSELGWLEIGPLVLLIAGAAALARWWVVSARAEEPLIDVRGLGGPLLLTLLIVVLATGSYQSMLQLLPLVGDVPLSQGLGYGLAGQGSTAMLLAAPGVGVMIGGPLAGVLAARFGPVVTLAGAVALGTIGTAGMFAGVGSFPTALVFALLLGFTVGALGTSGFNVAGSLAPASQQATVSSLVMVVVAIGSVVFNFVGSAVLRATALPAAYSGAGVFTYIAIASVAFGVSTALAVVLIRQRKSTR
ncbi:MFS transporter [Saccharopolyspora dendranthemae]|uniref:MFS transporter n=1 Tax=Saccharopolyspora dendranthemae TaxID=1181886 RepID=A0A561V8C8_9PSEU|nr:MFS transporter [Saccharopolyspora dendranthemae]TWG07865.1 MFS transporter [Saccharopolyspora dendranthemae]